MVFEQDNTQNMKNHPTRDCYSWTGKILRAMPAILFCLCTSLFSASVPTVKIPQITPKKAEALATAKSFDVEAWKGAAMIRAFQNPSSALGQIPEDTAFYLFHDGVQLLAAAHCKEKDFANARAFPRGVDSNLTLDESVQIVLGLEGKVSGTVAVGGYEGAYHEQGRCDHIYEMTTSLAGVSNRCYDETMLPYARFTSVVVRSDDSWTVFFRIPFASVGYDWKRPSTLYFNAFRFYRSERYGWYLPAFGGYHQLPMGKAQLLAQGHESEATVEAVPPPKADSKKEQSVVLGRLDLEYYAAAGEVGAEIPSGREGALITLTVDGESVSGIGSRHWPTRLKLPVNAKAGATSTAVFSCNDQVLQKKEFTVNERPKWRTGVAKEYLDERVVYPWSSPTFMDGVMTLTHGSMKFDDGMLPVSIMSCRGKEILNGPITLEAEANGKQLLVNRRKSFRQTPTAVEMISTARSGLELKTRTEYDGFMTVRARLTGMDTTVPNALRLRIPLAKGLAQYMIKGNSQAMVKLGGYGYHGNMGDSLWVGDRDGGIIFTFGHYLFFSNTDGRQIELNGDELVITMVSKDGVKPPKDNVFEFHLQFTPFRNDSIKPLNADLWFEVWSRYQSYPDLTKIPEMTQRVLQAQKQGKDLYVYFGQVMAENAPEFAAYPKDFTAYPRRPWYQRAYEPGKGVPCSVVCFRREAGEFMLDKIDTLVAQTGLRGVYLDGPTVPFWCLNLNHPCSPFLPAEWDGSWHEGCIAGQRSYIKRLRGIFESRGIQNPIWHHTGGGFNLATFSHCDYYSDGEQLSRYRRGYLVPPDLFSVIYSGYPFGYQGILWPSFFMDAVMTHPFRHAHAWCAPHGIVAAFNTTSYVEEFMKITKRAPETIFYSYTGKQPHIHCLNDNTLCTSYYLAAAEAVLISSNLVYHGTQKNIVDVSGMFPGKALQVHCLNREETPQFADGKLQFSVAEGDMRVYHICPASIDIKEFGLPNPKRKLAEVPPAMPLQEQKGFQAEKWQIESGIFAPIAESGLPYGLKADEQRAVLRYKESLPDNVNLKLKFRHSQKFKFSIDGVDISFDYTHTTGGIYHAGGWVIENVDRYDYLDRCDVSTKNGGRCYAILDRPVDVDIYIIDNRVSFFYDGVRVLQYGLPAVNHEAGHTISVETKDKSWLAFDLLYLGLATEKEMPRWSHPVR